MEIKISVVVPTYRRSVLLERCVKALVNQSFSKEAYEIIIVSDGPDQITRKIVEAWAKQDFNNICYVSLLRNKGPAAARNAGWIKAKGVIIAFTDDDCIPESDWLKFIWQEYQGESEIAYSGKVIVPVTLPPTDFERNTRGLESAEFVTANCAVTKTALEKIDGFDEQFRMAWREDSDLEFKLLQNQIPLHRINEAIVIHPVRKASWGISIKEQKKGMFNALLYKKYPKLYRRKIQPTPPINYYAMLIFFMIMTAGLIFKIGWITLAGFLVWFGFLSIFIFKRLSATSHSFNHVVEMIITSLIIPFVSVYWQLYGAWKYRVLFF